MNTGRSSSNLVWRRGWDEGRKREEKEDDEEEKKERTVKRFQPERFHSGNRFLIVERTMESNVFHTPGTWAWESGISTRIIVHPSISFFSCWLNDVRKRLIRREIRRGGDIYLKNRDLISFDSFKELESDLMYIFIKLVSWMKKILYACMSITVFYIRALIL